MFGEHKDLVMSLLNSLLPIAEDAPIVSVEYENTELTPQNVGRNAPVGRNSVSSIGQNQSLTSLLY